MTATGDRIYFQDRLLGNHCFGCGAENDKGLRIHSYWDGEEAVCRFEPQPHHSAMPRDIVNGGILAALIDCHCVCAAIADAYRREGREMGEGEVIWYATGSLQVNYRKPTRLKGPITVRARVTLVSSRKTFLDASLYSSDGELTVDGKVLAVRVPKEWADPAGLMKHVRK